MIKTAFKNVFVFLGVVISLPVTAFGLPLAIASDNISWYGSLPAWVVVLDKNTWLYKLLVFKSIGAFNIGNLIFVLESWYLDDAELYKSLSKSMTVQLFSGPLGVFSAIRTVFKILSCKGSL